MASLRSPLVGLIHRNIVGGVGPLTCPDRLAHAALSNGHNGHSPFSALTKGTIGMSMSRRQMLAVTATTGLVAACGSPSAPGSGSPVAASAEAVPDAPEKAVVLNILDVAGNLQLTQTMIDDFVKNNPKVISKVTYATATAPDLVGKIKAQQQAGRVDIGLVLTGTDGLSAGLEQGLWQELLPANEKLLTNMETYQEPAAAMQALGGKSGIVVTYYPSGPLLEYMPDRVPNPPTTAQELLAYAKANPARSNMPVRPTPGPGAPC